MPISAYVFIECTAGAAKDVARETSKIQGVRKSNSTTGPYDVIVNVQVPDLRALGELVSEQIQIVDGVATTFTCVVSG